MKNRIFYFLRALNSIQPLLLRRRLGVMQPDNTKVSWIIDYLADRPQFVPSRSTLLDLQQQRGIVLSTLFTASDCRLGSGSHRLHSLPDRLQRCSCSALYCAASDYFSDYTLLLAGMDSKHCKEAWSILHSSATVSTRSLKDTAVKFHMKRRGSFHGFHKIFAVFIHGWNSLCP